MTRIESIYSEFKPYSAYKNNASKPKINYKALGGAVVGTCIAMLAADKVFGTGELPIIKDASKLITIAGGANIGGVLGGSVGASDNSKKKKWKEAGFQIMNMALPMIMVSSFVGLTKKVDKLNKIPIKIIGSFMAMATGAFAATKITNLTKKENEQKRKYTIKDSTANFDDIIATIKLGFKEITDIVPVQKILPFIYIYSGARAGSKE